MKKVKVVDTFPFNGDWVVRMRLEFMFQFVDEFVITESWHTYSGVRKDFLYKDKWANVLKPYQSKIHWVIVDEYLPITEEWHNDYKDHTWFREEHKQAWLDRKSVV